MSTTVLGISAFYHDAAAAIIRDGEIIGAAQEERFTRKKHDPRFPVNAINYCLGEAFIEPEELDAVAFYDHPLLTLDRVIKSVMSAAPGSENQWQRAARSILGNKLFVEDHIRRAVGQDVKIYFAEHHASHAASAFFPSPFEKAAILTFDGVGEWATTTLGVGDDSRIQLWKEIDYPHSLGLLYSAFTYFCGFKVNSGEYKLMGLAPYGEPKYVDLIHENLIDVRPDGSFRMNLDYFGYLDSDRMTNNKFEDLFEGPPRAPESRITRREMDIAASIQKVTEQIVLKVGRYLRTLTGLQDAVLAGGVALNCVANGLLVREGVFENVWIQPAAGDAGGSLGAAMLVSHHLLGVARKMDPSGSDSQRGSFIGPSFSKDQVRAFLDRGGYRYIPVGDDAARAEMIAAEIAEGKVVGFFNGRMEFGPRALGGRSILGDPRRPETQSKMNLKIKYRESFRPFAPSVLVEKCSDYFELSFPSPYMLLVAPVVAGRRIPTKGNLSDDLLEVVNTPRSDIPAVTHIDYSARVQTVDRDTSPAFYEVIEAFDRLTGIPLLVNTSFNVRGEPIVCSPYDAYRCFMGTEMDMLVLEDCVLFKRDQPGLQDSCSWKDDLDLD